MARRSAKALVVVGVKFNSRWAAFVSTATKSSQRKSSLNRHPSRAHTAQATGYFSITELAKFYGHKPALWLASLACEGDMARSHGCTGRGHSWTTLT
eukprot:6211183-Pleurochrysis_carterae.AAC.4